jgi:ATP-dependent DNA ligase
MPAHEQASQPPPIDPAEWRPQGFGGKGSRSMVDPIIEPSWGGVRVIVRVGAGSDGSPAATLTDEDGRDATTEFAELARVIAAATLAGEAVLDGYLTVEPTQPSTGIDMTMGEAPTQGQVLAQLVVGSHGRSREARPKLDSERPIAFVAVDLLSIDGSSLIDIPLLERKRLLEGTLRVENLVRITPFVRTPIGSLAVTWHSQGFRELVYKPSGGRYKPTGKSSDWTIVPISGR